MASVDPNASQPLNPQISNPSPSSQSSMDDLFSLHDATTKIEVLGWIKQLVEQEQAKGAVVQGTAGPIAANWSTETARFREGADQPLTQATLPSHLRNAHDALAWTHQTIEAIQTKKVVASPNETTQAMIQLDQHEDRLQEGIVQLKTVSPESTEFINYLRSWGK